MTKFSMEKKNPSLILAGIAITVIAAGAAFVKKRMAANDDQADRRAA